MADVDGARYDITLFAAITSVRGCVKSVQFAESRNPETRPVVPGSATAIAIPVSSRRFTAEIESLTVGCVKDLGDSIRFFDRRNTNSPVSIDQ